MPSFDDVARAVAGVPFMSPAQGRLVHDHIVAAGAHATSSNSGPRTASAPPTWPRRARA